MNEEFLKQNSEIISQVERLHKLHMERLQNRAPDSYPTMSDTYDRTAQGLLKCIRTSEQDDKA